MIYVLYISVRIYSNISLIFIFFFVQFLPNHSNIFFHSISVCVRSVANILVLIRPSRNASTFRTRSATSSYHTPSLHISPIVMSLNIYAYLFTESEFSVSLFVSPSFSTNFLPSFPVLDAQAFRQWGVLVLVPTPILRLRESADSSTLSLPISSTFEFL